MDLVIENHDIECIIGVWPHERTKAQRVGLNLRLTFDAAKASRSDTLNDTINYAQLVEAATFIMQSGQFQLLETAVRVLVHFFLLPKGPGDDGATARAVDLTLTKYDALPQDTLASVRMRAKAEDVSFAHEHSKWGKVDIIAESNDVGFYCLHIAPHKTLPLHHHEVMYESEFIMDEGLKLLELDTDPRRLSQGEVFTWAHHHVHGYENVSDRWCRVLCKDAPPFIPEDEVIWTN